MNSSTRTFALTFVALASLSCGSSSRTPTIEPEPAAGSATNGAAAAGSDGAPVEGHFELTGVEQSGKTTAFRDTFKGDFELVYLRYAVDLQGKGVEVTQELLYFADESYSGCRISAHGNAHWAGNGVAADIQINAKAEAKSIRVSKDKTGALSAFGSSNSCSINFGIPAGAKLVDGATGKAPSTSSKEIVFETDIDGVPTRFHLARLADNQPANFDGEALLHAEKAAKPKKK